MRVMLDTNILVSVAVLHSRYLTALVDILAKYHTIVLSTYIIEELKRVTKEKFPNKSLVVEDFLTELPFELVYTPETIDAQKYPDIRDAKDLPVLVTAIAEDVDVLLSRDEDFAPLNLMHPEVLKPRDFLEKYHNDYDF
jgi:putative PIN family toxin of toxin-antitoxin system